MNSKQSGRRKFLKSGAALAGLAAGGIQFADGQMSGSQTGDVRLKDLHAYGVRSRFETAVRRDVGWLMNPLQDSVGIITPPAVHYTVSHNYEPPVIDPREHR